MPEPGDRPGGNDATLVGRPNAEPATADPADAAAPTVAQSSNVAAAAAPQLAVASRPASQPSSRPAAESRSRGSVGEEMRGASVERLGTVPSGRFELLDELARGGLGRVFRARDPRTNRIVAIKEVLHPQPDIMARFAREAMVTANLQHPAIVPVYEVGRWQSGEPYYAMKLVQGRTLDQLIRETTTTDGRVALVPHVIAVADALAYAHGERVIHRDLKPGNVLVGAYGETIVIDWGLAKNLATGEELDALPVASTIPPDNVATVVGSVVGTPCYMPPEQALGKQLDERADVYAIGAILYHVVTGIRPFAEFKVFEDLMEAVAYRTPRPVLELAPQAPAELIAIVDKAMAPAPEARYATADGLAQDLRRFQAGKLVGAHRYTSGQLVRRWIAAHRGLVATSLVAAAVLIAVGVVSFVKIAAERDTAEAQKRIADDASAAAEAARAREVQHLADSLEDRARQQLVAGSPDRALTLLAEAEAIAPRTGATRDVIGSQARAAYAGLVAVAPAQLSGTTGAEISGDGRRLYLAAADGEALAWDGVAQRPLWTAADVGPIELSPDERLLATRLRSGELAVIRTDTGQIAARWPATTGAVDERATHVRWSADGAYFAAVTPAGRTFVVQPAANAVRELERHGRPPTYQEAFAAAFSPDGRAVATAGGDGVTLVHELASGRTTARLVGTASVYSVAWLDADHVVTGDSEGAVKIWQVSRAHVDRTFAQPPGHEVFGVVVGGAPATWLASYGLSDVVTVWDLATGTARVLPGHQVGVDHALSDGTRLITTDEAGHLFVWDPDTGERLQTVPIETSNIALSTRGGRVVVLGSGRTRVFRFASDASIRHVTGHTGRVRDLAFSPDGATLWSASNDGTARGYDLASGHAIVLGQASLAEPAVTTNTDPVRPPNPHGLRSLQLTPDGATVATAGEDGTLELWDTRTGASRRRLVGHTGRVRRVAFGGGGRTAYSVGDTTLRKWDVATGRELGRADLGEELWDVDVTEDGNTVVTLTQRGKLGLWQTSSLASLATADRSNMRDLVVAGNAIVNASETRVFLLGGNGAVLHEVTQAGSHAISVGPKLIAVANKDFEIALFDRSALTPVRHWHVPEAQSRIQFRPDGAVLASSSLHRVRLWDPTTGELLAETAEIPALVTAPLVWSPDGHLLAFSGGSGTVFVWELPAVAPASIGAYARCASPWRLDQAELIEATFDPSSCVGIATR